MQVDKNRRIRSCLTCFGIDGVGFETLGLFKEQLLVCTHICVTALVPERGEKDC